MKKYKIEETIVVEGKYDKIKLSSFIDANIIVTNGFSVFQDEEKVRQIRMIAQKTGIVILTDSDRAGFMIRNYVKQGIPPENIIQAYIPEVFGKEKRKKTCSKEGKLGVEGIDVETIIETLKRAGCHFGDECTQKTSANLSKADLYLLGFSGQEDSVKRREKLCIALSLPKKMPPNSLLCTINTLFESKEAFLTFLEENEL